jgi:hypothetical protein
VYLKRFDILTLLGDQVLISCRVKLEHEEREEPRGDQLTGDMRVDQQEEAHNITVLAFAFDGDCRVKKTMELPHLDLEEFWKRLKKCVETGKLEIS